MTVIKTEIIVKNLKYSILQFKNNQIDLVSLLCFFLYVFVCVCVCVCVCVRERERERETREIPERAKGRTDWLVVERVRSEIERREMKWSRTYIVGATFFGGRGGPVLHDEPCEQLLRILVGPEKNKVKFPSETLELARNYGFYNRVQLFALVFIVTHECIDNATLLFNLIS